MFEKHHLDRMSYLIHRPDDFAQGEKYPVILLFHGSGSRGSNVETLKRNAYFAESSAHSNRFITVAPQCHEDSWVELWDNVKRLVDEIRFAEFTDTDRIYAMGPSMGGYAVWQIAISMPQVFAAIVPMCAGGMYWNAGRIKNIPIWAFHGARDELIDCRDSEKMVDAVNAVGGNARLTVYPELGHEIWETTYQNAEVFEWLLSNTRHRG